MVWTRGTVGHSARGQWNKRVLKSGSKYPRIGARRYRISKKYPKGDVIVRRSIDPMPDQQVVKLRYVQYATVAGGVGVSTKTFRANGLFDPDESVGGHQPMHFDRYASMYQHYVVLGARMTVKAWTESNDTAYAGIIGIALDDNATIGTTIQNILEQGKRHVTYKPFRQIADGSHSIATLTKNFSAKKYFGYADMKDNQDEAGAATNADPVDQADFVIFWGHPDGSTEMDGVQLMVTIEYIASFSEPKSMAEN